MPRDEILGHADEADGIEEYDNALPGWWLMLFGLCCAWGFFYAVWFHSTGQSQERMYEEEVVAALAKWPAPAEASPVVVDEASVDAGKAVYDQNSIACHGADLTGGIGPDLTDDVWVNGGTVEEIRAVVTGGVPEKGMLAWGPILGPEKVAQVSAYVHEAGGGQ